MKLKRKDKAKFNEYFTQRVFTQFHMFLILLSTYLSGIVFSKILLTLGVKNIIYRYSITLLIGYGVFFVLFKLWLKYYTSPFLPKNEKENSKSKFDFPDPIDFDIPTFKNIDLSSHFIGNGGSFGGGGASGSWSTTQPLLKSEAATSSISKSVTNAVSEKSSNAISDTAKDIAGETVSGASEKTAVIIIPIMIIILTLLGGSIYLIYQAPAIISEAAFELILATSLVKQSKKIGDPNWVGSLFKATITPFIFTFFITAICAFYISKLCPDATKIKEVLQMCVYSTK